ncbi:TetR/AcrR family transcriptional regulator [Amnibacterium kyonggiense]
MVDETSDRPKLTAKGARTRARIVEQAAVLIHQRGVAGTTLDDVKVAADVSGSQMYHYFPDKNDLVQAVIDYQADAIIQNNQQAFSRANGVQAWRDMVVTGVRAKQAVGGCELGSLGGQLAESDPESRALVAAGFDRWAAVIGDALRTLDDAGGCHRARTRTISPRRCSRPSREGCCSPRCIAAPNRSKPRSTPSSLSQSADRPAPPGSRRPDDGLSQSEATETCDRRVPQTPPASRRKRAFGDQRVISSGAPFARVAPR